MKRLTQISLVLGVCILLHGCGDRQASEREALERVPTTSNEAATQLEQVFANVPDSQPRQLSSELAAAMRQRNYSEALKAMDNLRRQQALDIQQVMAIENAKRRLQADVLQAMEAGDPNAKRAWEAMKRAGKS